VLDKQRAIDIAMRHPESLVVSIDYCADTEHTEMITRRVISPVEYSSNFDFVAFCLSRGEFRRFKLRRINRFQLIDANTVLAPAPFAAIDLSISDPTPADCRP